MPIARQYSYAEISAAIDRANGQKLAEIKVGAVNGQEIEDLAKSRVVQTSGTSPYKKGYGHAYAHIDSFTQNKKSPTNTAIAQAQDHKSRWQNKRTCIEAAMEMINRDVGVQAHLAKYDGPTPPTDLFWPKKIPLTGSFYGVSAGEKFVRKAATGSINFMVVGFTLVIYSCYPDSFLAVTDTSDMADLGQLFGPNW